MANQPTPTQPPTYSEAPASWNVRYSLEGFDCQFTLRGESGADLLPRTLAALKWLMDQGATGARSQAPAGPAPAPQPAPVLASGEPDPGWCAIHNVAMGRREKDGQVWYSHKNGEGYCRGKNGK